MKKNNIGNGIDHKALFNQMPVPRFLVRRDGNDFIICEADDKALQFFERSRAALIGCSLKDLLDNENARQMEQSFHVCLERKSPVTIQSLPTFPGSVRVPGFWVTPVMDADGNVSMIDVIAQPPPAAGDTILQRERDDALSLLTSIFDVSEAGILITDTQRRIVKVNDSFVRTYGWEREELVGTDFVGIVTADEQEAARRNHAEFIESGTRTSGEMKIMRKDGGIANALFTTANLNLSHNRRFQVTTVMDITRRKQMEFSLRVAKDRADTANHAKSAFLANMSHELRTPLNAIIGFSEMILKETFGPVGSPKYAEYLGDIHLSARHLLEIINEVLDMSKIEAGRVELDEKEIDIRALIDSVIRIMDSRAFSGGLEIIEEIDPDLPQLYADPRLVRQILINLVTNAVKYTKTGGTITVQASVAPEGCVQIVVADTGVGIPKDRIEKAMEPFGQINDSAHQNGYQGTGLGLPLAKAMAELHGGTLNLQSEVGEGTIVKVTFPRRRVRWPVSSDDTSGAGMDIGETVEVSAAVQ